MSRKCFIPSTDWAREPWRSNRTPLIAASKVTKGALDEKAHRKLIDDAIAELDFSALEGRNN